VPPGKRSAAKPQLNAPHQMGGIQVGPGLLRETKNGAAFLQRQSSALAQLSIVAAE